MMKMMRTFLSGYLDDAYTHVSALSSLEFDDTYDGLGDRLEEANDDLNDDTFGGGGSAAAAPKPVGKDFDFYGQTAKVSDALNEEHLIFNRQQAPPKSVAAHNPTKSPPKPFRTGYEAYKNPGYIPNLQVDASLWATAPTAPVNNHGYMDVKLSSQGSEAVSQRPPSGVSAKKMMSLEEVEASMRSQAKRPNPAPQVQHQQSSQMPATSIPQQQYPFQQTGRPHPPTANQPSSQQTLQQQPFQYVPTASQIEAFRQQTQEMTAPRIPVQQPVSAPQILQRGQRLPQQTPETRGSPQPRQILQNPRRQQAQLAPRPVEPPVHSQSRAPIPVSSSLPNQLPIITHPQQLMQLSEEDRNAFLIEDAKRAKRNHKIYLLSRDNGLMTPQDKNFITRIQLQQLMTATGNVTEQDPDASLSEDFYYQVHSQIRGGSRQNPQQPLSNFAQTYLFQTGSRQGGIARRQNRGGDNHMQRMEQQVQRAVEAAKLKPKNKQLIIEGSLGKISFSNAKTPKPLLNIKRQENGDANSRPKNNRHQSSKSLGQTTLSASDRKTVLRNIEAIYSTLMNVEDHERRLPPVPTEASSETAIQQYAEWRHTMEELNKLLWSDLKLWEPIIPNSPVLHPFIAFLSYPKGKKAMPRIFRHIDEEQRLTILTMIIVHLNVLDVIRLVQPQLHDTRPPATAREEVELFSQAVMPCLFGYVNEAPLNIVIGLLGLILDRVNMQVIARTKIGLGILTMLISRAELVKQAEATNDHEWEQWLTLYNRLFDTVEPILGDIFPGSINTSQDMYVWQFLAAMGIGASPDQQQRLVIAVKYVLVYFILCSDTNGQTGTASWKPSRRARPYLQIWRVSDSATLIYLCAPLGLMSICLARTYCFPSPVAVNMLTPQNRTKRIIPGPPRPLAGDRPLDRTIWSSLETRSTES